MAGTCKEGRRRSQHRANVRLDRPRGASRPSSASAWRARGRCWPRTSSRRPSSWQRWRTTWRVIRSSVPGRASPSVAGCEGSGAPPNHGRRSAKASPSSTPSAQPSGAGGPGRNCGPPVRRSGVAHPISAIASPRKSSRPLSSPPRDCPTARSASASSYPPHDLRAPVSNVSEAGDHRSSAGARRPETSRMTQAKQPARR